jgi:hypothetical protein
MLEEDLFFPGKLIDNDTDSESESDSELLVSRRDSLQDPPVPEANESEEEESVTAVASSGPSENSVEGPPTTPTTSSITFSGTPSRSNSPTADESPAEGEASDEARELLAQVYIDYSTTSQTSKIDDAVAVPQQKTRPLLYIKTPMTQVPNPHPQSRLAGSTMSLLMSSMASMAPPDSLINAEVEIKSNPRARGYSLISPLSKPEIGQAFQTEPPSIPQHSDIVPNTPPSPAIKFPPFLLRTVPKPPANPRDHSLLETIYTQMLGARFINSSPLALLANSLGQYFKGKILPFQLTLL